MGAMGRGGAMRQRERVYGGYGTDGEGLWV